MKIIYICAVLFHLKFSSMKKFNPKFLSVTSRICIAGLSLLGFGCSSDEEEPCMYGTPTAEFEVKGMVTDPEGKPVKDVKMIITDKDTPSGLSSYGISQTGENGQYSLEGKYTGFPNDKFKIVCKPTDSAYESDSTVVTLKKVAEGEGWETGKGEGKVDFVLKKKATE